MARAYSSDLRERVVAAVGDGQSCRQVAAVFRVSVASVVKWSQRARQTGSVLAKPMGGRPVAAFDAAMRAVLEEATAELAPFGRVAALARRRTLLSTLRLRSASRLATSSGVDQGGWRVGARVGIANKRAKSFGGLAFSLVTTAAAPKRGDMASAWHSEG